VFKQIIFAVSFFVLASMVSPRANSETPPDPQTPPPGTIFLDKLPDNPADLQKLPPGAVVIIGGPNSGGSLPPPPKPPTYNEMKDGEAAVLGMRFAKENAAVLAGHAEFSNVDELLSSPLRPAQV
jgi:hypothetical protein